MIVLLKPKSNIEQQTSTMTKRITVHYKKNITLKMWHFSWGSLNTMTIYNQDGGYNKNKIKIILTGVILKLFK